MNATLRIGMAEVRFVTHAVDVNIAVVAVDCAAFVKSGFKPAEPKNAIGDACVRVAFAVCADRYSAFENCTNRRTRADFFGNALEAEGCLKRIHLLPRAVFGCGGGEYFGSVAVKMRECLRRHVDVQAMVAERNVQSRAGGGEGQGLMQYSS